MSGICPICKRLVKKRENYLELDSLRKEGRERTVSVGVQKRQTPRYNGRTAGTSDRAAAQHSHTPF